MISVERRHNIRFEKRGREFVAVAKLTRFYARELQRKQEARNTIRCEGPRVNAREVTAT